MNGPLPHFLAPGVHAVRIRDDLVFLDVAADAYFCLGDAAAGLALAPGGRIDIRCDETAAQLLEAGLVALEPSGIDPLPPPAARASAFGGTASRRLPTRLLGRALQASWSASSRLARRSFAELLEPSAERGRLLAPPEPALLQAAADFERIRPWIPFRGECLARSYQLRAFLRGLGFDALWVFGVRTWPFTAHCWLQVGDTALDEDLERLVAYTPILAV